MFGGSNEDVEEITFNLPQYHSFVEFKENENTLLYYINQILIRLRLIEVARLSGLS